MGEKDAIKNESEKKKSEPAGNSIPLPSAAEADGKKVQEPINVVLNLDLHCQGCAKKVRRSISRLEGVTKVKVDCDAKKLIVTGNVDPTWLRQTVENKTKKQVALVSPQPKTDVGGGGGGGDNKAEQKPEVKTKENTSGGDNKKPTEAVISTVIMKIKLHCDGCAEKIERVILKNIDGVKSVKADLQRDLVTLMGTMDVQKLIPYLREKLKRSVDIVVPTKNKNAAGDKNDDAAGDKKDGGGGEDEKKKEKANEGNVGGAQQKEEKSKLEETKVEMNKMEYSNSNSLQTYYTMPMYNHTYASREYYTTMYSSHQPYWDTGYAASPPPPPPTYLDVNDTNMFSDENPNGCSVM